MQFNYHSPRARQARFRRILAKKITRVILDAASLALFAGWALLVLVLDQPIGNLLLFCLPVTLMPPIWYRAYLEELPIYRADSSVENLLEPELLGLLPVTLDATSLVVVLEKTKGVRFYGSRFAISPQFIKNTVEGVPLPVDIIWQQSLELSKKYNEPMVSSAAVFVAVLKQVPEHEFYLAQLNLTIDDIEAGLAWHEHIRKVFLESSQKNSFGGLGRDLSFGYAPLLNRFGFNISQNIVEGGLLHRDIESREDLFGQTLHLLSQPGRRNATLVGEVGVGKTTFVYALAKRLMDNKNVPKELAYQQVISLDSASIIANAKGRGQLEELLIRMFNEAAKAKNIILFLDDAQLFLKSGTGSVDLSNVLLQVLEGGAIRLILSLDEQEWLRLGQNNPGLAQLMNRVAVKPLEAADTMRVIEDQVLLLEIKNKATYMYQALKEASNLAGKYIQEQAAPGNAIKLLESASSFKEQEYFVTEKSVQRAIERSYGVKVQTAKTQSDKDVLLNLEGRIHERMINQTHAVSVVSDALRRARAGVKNQQKPIGTFLFLGPTGVGKTELSKSLAAVYFGGEQNMVRVDLNEYSGANDVGRLIAAPAENAMSLTAQISKQPFSVVLLDEIEKAHTNVLNVLLQMLDEGVLRDSNNKEISFKDAIIICTSNAGAQEIRAHIESGQKLEDFESEFIDGLIDQRQFTPEFLNRFDEIVLFRPLNKEELLQVVDLILAGLNKTLAPQKVKVTLTNEAKALLAEAGYDPRLGARPLKRVMQRSIENIVAKQLLSGQTGAGATIKIDAPDIQNLVNKPQN